MSVRFTYNFLERTMQLDGIPCPHTYCDGFCDLFDLLAFGLRLSELERTYDEYENYNPLTGGEL